MTTESVPALVSPPTLSALSPTSVRVSWAEPATPNGIIILYRLYLVSTATGQRELLLLSGSVGVEVVEGLRPFTEYGFQLEACTSVGCNESEVASVFTLESAPLGQSSPQVTNTSSTSISLQWSAPTTPNGIIINYLLHRRSPSLLPSPSLNDIGISLDGTGFASFPPEASILGGFANEIRLSFRTLHSSGVLLYYINAASTDILVIEFRNGIPWFIFDAGSGPGAIRPEGGVAFNDGLWHELVTSQEGRLGTITVDGVHTGSGESVGSSQVISSNQVLYFGGIPDDAPLTTQSGGLNPDAAVRGERFAGCVFGVTLNGEEPDFSSQSSPSSAVGSSNRGCPVGLEVGTTFLGGGFLRLPANTISSSVFSFSFQVRTTHDAGLVFFAYGGEGNATSTFGLEIRDSFLAAIVTEAASNFTFESSVSVIPLCDGEWHSILIDQDAEQLSLTVDLATHAIPLPSSSDFVLSSSVYIGGVAMDTSAYTLALETGLNVYAPFSGCLRHSSEALVVGGALVSVVVEEAEFVRYDGCGSSVGSVCDAAWEEVDAGLVMERTDGGLNAFSDYLYRVSSANSAGQANSPWIATMTGEGAPTGVGPVSLLSSTDSSMAVSWDKPSTPNGLITQYTVTALPVSTVGLPSPVGGSATAELLVEVPEALLEAELAGLVPATSYAVTLTAFTVGGGGGSGPAVTIATNESIPSGVQPPVVVLATSRSLELQWGPPTQPNGVITRYDLFVNSVLQFSGPGNTTRAIVDNLAPFTLYSLLLQACTGLGCSNSSEATGETLPDRPSGLAAPNLTALSPSTVEAVWLPPAQPNGELLRFELLRLFGPSLSQNETVFTGLNLTTTISGLTPNTMYYFQLLAFNAGGSTASSVAQVLTLEDIPDGINPPAIQIINATSLLISWEEPTEPNGVITEYILVENGVQIFPGLVLSYVATGLQPFTMYSYNIMACTVRGCGSSSHSTVRTPEAVAEGYVAPNVTAVAADSITVQINPVSEPNGIVTYVLEISGEFQAPDIFNTVFESRVIYNSSDVGSATVSELLPFTSYSLVLSVVNSAGTLEGEPFTVQTAPAPPEGLSAPTLSLLDATTLLAEWASPSRPNGPVQSFQLTVVGPFTTLTLDRGLNLTATIPDLTPFTQYIVFVTVFNSEGSVDSPAENVTTGETDPFGFDQVVVVEREARSILISWDPPAAPNGILVNYTVFQDDRSVAVVSPAVTEFNVTALLPFSSYMFYVAVCNSAGCVGSSSVTAMTLEDVPEGVPAPFVSAGISQTVLISWTAPASPNGILLFYYIERAFNGSFSQIGVVNATASLVFVDTETSPFTTYNYRIIAVNSAGSGVGEATIFSTPEAAPTGVFPPALAPQSSSSIEVSFLSPTSPNGIITSYTLTRSSLTPTPLTITIPLDISTLETSGDYYIYIDEELRPFTNYTYTLTICTEGGCSTSTPVWAVTFEDSPVGLSAPAVAVLGSTLLLVSWEEPSEPNGEIQGYSLLRRDLGFYDTSADSIDCCEEYLSNSSLINNSCGVIAEVAPVVRSFNDSSAEAYSFYQYCVIVSNNVDSLASGLSPPVRTDPAPMPVVGPLLNATTVNSTAIDLLWSFLGVADLLGPLEGYTLYIRISGVDGPRSVLFTGLMQSFTATGLFASTEYEFTVSVSNGRGSAFSNVAIATTEEGIPSNLPAPTVDVLGSTSLSITWVEPLEPNGIIISYTIFLDSIAVHNRSNPGTLEVRNLTPFTLYTVQVEACTQFGCTRSPLVAQTTDESAPVGLASPVIVITGPRSANISWSAPNQPNGIITEYQLLQRTVSSCPTCYQTSIVFSGLAFGVLLADLRPFTEYGFEVVAVNSAGNVSSGFTTAQTEEAPPTSVAPPAVFVVSAREIYLSWTEPEELNGMLTGYQIYRDNVLLFSSLALDYVDTSVSPFTEYVYILEACTNGGCTNSTPVSNTTIEALPEFVSDPVISNLQPRSLVVSWIAPGSPNGIITEYILTLTSNDTVLFSGLAFSLPLNNLVPFTNYTFQLSVCNSIGCTLSGIVSVETPQAPPEGLEPPRLRDLTATSVAIEWSPPAVANGIISSYILRRGDENGTVVVVFEGIGFSHNDFGLIADTLYFYTVEVVNGGGSLESSPSYIRTIPDLPDGISPPQLDVRGATEIHITWTPPERPNGEISHYILYINDVAVFTGIAFEYTAENLSPFTLYSFYYQVCNPAGCAASITVSELTDSAAPEGVSPPTLEVLGSTAIQVSWVPPTMPNGIINRYEIRRRLLDNPLTETIQHVNGPSLLSFPNSGLEPFTSYEYRLRVYNDAGSTFSEWVSARTDEDIPIGVPLPMIADSDIFSRNVTATWTAPTNPNGIILSYRFEYRLLLDPSTNMPGAPITADTIPSSIMTVTVVGLLPVTTYEFRVIAINGAGEGEGDWQIVTTDEDFPEGLQAIVVEERTGNSLTLTWSAPLMPNGQIREYMILLDGEVVYRNTATTYTVLRLQPFTSYSLQLAACTSAGCTFGEVQTVTTAQTPPLGQAAPELTALSPRSVEITWTSPQQPNGIITQYEIMRQDDDLPSSLSVIYSTDDTANLLYIDNTVEPAMPYQYAVRAINSAGQTESNFQAITTPDAAPEGVSAPLLAVISSREVQVSWEPPSKPNGMITQYQGFRSGGGSSNQSVYSGLNRLFTDSSLTPFTAYSYSIEACTSGGCSIGPSSSAITLEDTPSGFVPPVLSALSSTSISIAWSPPSTPNGIITQYIVSILPVSITVTTAELAVNITNLLPFTDYTVSIDACNSVGCATASSIVRTLESTPQFIAAPQLETLSPTSVRITWQEPSRPNGFILFYNLRRNGTSIQNTSNLVFEDTNLSPFQYYSYTVQAYTSIGGGDISGARVIQTPQDTPVGVSPPQLIVLGPYSIRATWAEPEIPNGEPSYFLLISDIPDPISAGVVFEYTVENLQPFTEYEFQLQACTTTCGNSTIATAVTEEAAPSGLPSPQLSLITNTSVNVSWSEPTERNGIITSYQLARRLIPTVGTPGSFEDVFTGLETAYRDSSPSLLPAMSYEYRVTVFNSAGSFTSDSSQIILPEAAPSGVPLPVVQATTSTSFQVFLSPPATPNGVLVEYTLYYSTSGPSSGMNTTVPDSQDTGVTLQLSGLDPYTEYNLTAEVCTCGGCGRSGNVTERTAESLPEELDAPTGTATVISARRVQIDWSPPTRPNGEITSYVLWYRLACPQPPQPQLVGLPDCAVGVRSMLPDQISGSMFSFNFTNRSSSADPLPYTAYQFQVEAENSIGSVVSQYSDVVETFGSEPEVIAGGLQFVVDQSRAAISLDWSRSFRLNGPLLSYSVSRNDFDPPISIHQTTDTQTVIANQPIGIRLEYSVTAVTEIGSVSTETIAVQIEAPTVNTVTERQETPVYRQPAFIAGMVIIGIAILFLLCGILLCFIHPRGDTAYKIHSSTRVPFDTTPTRKDGYQHFDHGPVTGSWSPGDPPWEDLPDIGEDVDEDDPVTASPKKSYSPRRAEASALLPRGDPSLLADTPISRPAIPGSPRFVPAPDDFSSFRAQRTTFQDTRV